MLVQVKEKVRFCEICGNVSEETQCRICRDERRDRSLICVVEEPRTWSLSSRTREFRGRYHVLGGAISPIEGLGPDELRIKELCSGWRTRVTEIILATDPNLRARQPRRI